jgi:hypothetical protein
LLLEDSAWSLTSLMYQLLLDDPSWSLTLLSVECFLVDYYAAATGGSLSRL